MTPTPSTTTITTSRLVQHCVYQEHLLLYKFAFCINVLFRTLITRAIKILKISSVPNTSLLKIKFKLQSVRVQFQ